MTRTQTGPIEPAGAPAAPEALAPWDGEANNPWRLALESSGSGVWDWNLVTGDQTHSPRWKAMLGYAEHEIGHDVQAFFAHLHPDDTARVHAARAAYLAGHTDHYAVDVRMQRKDGAWIWVMAHGMVVSRDAQGKALRMIGTHTDITERKQEEERLRALNLKLEGKTQLLQAMQSLSQIGGWEFDLVARKVVWTDELHRILETSPRDFQPVPGDTSRFLTPESLARLRAATEQARPGDPPQDLEIEALTAKGRTVWVHVVMNTVWDHGQQVRRLAMVHDITERRNAEKVIWEQAHFDPLTGLPNRRMLRDRLERDIRQSRRGRGELAVLFIDLDHFKEVNDTLGHDFGDLLLVEAARRIQGCVRETDTVARMGGDEFTVLLTELKSNSQLERILQKILDALAAVFQLRDEQVFVSGSVGVTLYPTDATEIEDLYKNADQALYAAKGAGRNRFSFYTPALQEAALMRVRMANELRTAVAEQQFRLMYQPIVNIANGRVHKAEALIRWQHPVHGLVSPATFIPVAETSGLIVEIGAWVFAQALEQVRQWRARLAPDFQISINQSPVQFHHEDRGSRSWDSQLDLLGLPGESIVAEITEGLLHDTSARVASRLKALRAAGIQMSLDDFGTGYSSLAHLHKFDIDVIKIDHSFVRHLAPASTDLALCKAIIVMAHELGKVVVAEGVETQAQCDLLLAAGCDYAQGYLFARPMAPVEFEAFLKHRHQA
jgi:diguanylate cyclase (GGDEF)-like protein/PAS domain S-box-containing protein